MPLSSRCIVEEGELADAIGVGKCNKVIMVESARKFAFVAPTLCMKHALPFKCTLNFLEGEHSIDVYMWLNHFFVQ